MIYHNITKKQQLIKMSWSQLSLLFVWLLRQTYPAQYFLPGSVGQTGLCTFSAHWGPFVIIFLNHSWQLIHYFVRAGVLTRLLDLKTYMWKKFPSLANKIAYRFVYIFEFCWFQSILSFVLLTLSIGFFHIGKFNFFNASLTKPFTWFVHNFCFPY